MCKRIHRVFAMLFTMMICVVMLTGCGSEENALAGTGHSFCYTLVGNPDTLDPQLSQNDSAKTVLANLFEGLFTMDASGTVKPALVQDYQVSSDGLTYTFTLREDSYWYDAKHTDSPFSKESAVNVTAGDFVFAFRRLFDPMYHSPHRTRFVCLENAQDILDGKKKAETIGVYAKSANVLEFHLDTPNASFLQLLTLPAALPCNQDYFESTNGRYGLDESSVIGNGAFAMQTWLYDPYGKYNVVQLVRNPLAHQVSHTFPVDLTLYIEKSESDAVSLFLNGSTDCVITTQNSLLTRNEWNMTGAYSLTLGLAAAADSPYADQKIFESLTRSLDRSQISVPDDDLVPAYGIFPPSVTLLNKSLRELIAETAYANYDLQAGADMLGEAMYEKNIYELPEGKILVPSGMMDYAQLLKILDIWKEKLGVYMSIEEVADDVYASRIARGNYDLALIALSAENNAASSVVEAFLQHSALRCDHADELNELLADAANASNMNECVELYRQAETQMLESACFLPLFYKQRYLVCKKNVADVGYSPFSGVVEFKLAKYFD